LLEAERLGLSYTDAGDLVEAFVNEFLREENFSRVGLLGGRQWFANNKPAEPCRVLSSVAEASLSRADLGRVCLRGFDALFVSRKHPSFPGNHFLTRGYAVRERFDLNADASALFQDLPLSGPELAVCFKALGLRPTESVVLFGHDADPVYVIQHEP
jgi:hypothetical protein